MVRVGLFQGASPRTATLMNGLLLLFFKVDHLFSAKSYRVPSEMDYTESHGTFSIDYVIPVLLPSDLAHY